MQDFQISNAIRSNNLESGYWVLIICWVAKNDVLICSKPSIPSRLPGEVMKNCLDDISSDTFFFLSSLSNIWYYSWRLILCLVWSQKAKIGHERNGSLASMQSSPSAQQQNIQKDVKFTNFYKVHLFGRDSLHLHSVLKSLVNNTLQF